MMRRKWYIPVSTAAVLLGIGAWAVLRGGGELQYRTARVQSGNIEQTISATGTPNAVVYVQVGSQVSGNIMALYADFNTKVQKDQVIARIDPAIFQARVNQAQATLDSARANVINAQANVQKAIAEQSAAQSGVANARADTVRQRVSVQDAKTKLDRRIQLTNEGVLSREERDTYQATYDASQAQLDASQAMEKSAQDNANAAKAQVDVARTQLAQAQAQVKQTEAALAQAQADLEHTYIRAPVDGVVVARRVDVGQTVAASLQAPTLFEIAQDLTKMQVDTNVSEADVGKVQVGQPATFIVDAFPNDVFRGEVTAIRKAPINVQNVITYDVVIGVANPEQKLFPGMTANVKILVDKKDNVLKVPNAALRFRPADARPARGRQQQQTVYVLDDHKKAVPVPVETGLSDGSFTEVTSGNLKPGDAVIVAAFSGKKEDAAAPGFGSKGGRRGPGF